MSTTVDYIFWPIAIVPFLGLIAARFSSDANGKLKFLHHPGLFIFLTLWALAALLLAVFWVPDVRRKQKLVSLATDKDMKYFRATPTTGAAIAVPEKVAKTAVDALKTESLQKTIDQVEAKTTTGAEYGAFLIELNKAYGTAGAISSAGSTSGAYW